VPIKAFEILNHGKIRESQEKLQKFLEDKGFLLAKVDAQVEDITPGEKVKLTFRIEENEKVKVKKIRFLGNSKLKDDYLKNRMATQEGGFFSFMSGSGGYKQEAFDRDTQIL
jgi:outer membrane protein insertion porin family